MVNTRILLVLSCYFFCNIFLSQAARAGEAFQCDLYAKKAIAQVLTNEQYTCGLEGNRYSKDFALHYNWCRDVPGDDAAERENRARTVELANCQGTNWNRNADVYCTEYAKIAISQSTYAKQANCNVTGPRWDDKDFSSHYRWCMGVPGSWPESETNARRETLKQCGGKVFPPVLPQFKGDLTVVDWCFEDVNTNTIFNIVVKNIGNNLWTSTKDADLTIGLSSGGTTIEPARKIPFTELWGLSSNSTRIIRGVSMLSITPDYRPRANVVLAHGDDINTPDLNLTVNFTSENLTDFYSKYGSKRCNLLQ